MPTRKPWEGENWRNDKGLLIVGESQYWSIEGQDDPEMTCSVVSDVVSGTKLRFFTAAERVVSGCLSGKTEPASFWQTVAFANFCPGAVRKGSKVTPEMLRDGATGFPALLSTLRPRRILFMSKAAWDVTEKADFVWTETEPIVRDGVVQKIGFMGLPDFPPGALAMNINHPASHGWSADWWHPFVRNFLDRPL